jgi:hypothetical protein
VCLRPRQFVCDELASQQISRRTPWHHAPDQGALPWPGELESLGSPVMLDVRDQARPVPAGENSTDPGMV